MSKKINKFCKKCNKNTIFRFVNDKRKNPYYSCSVCLENNSKRYRKNNWEKYLAQKANSRKRKGSIILTERIIKNINRKQNNKCALTNIEFNIESKWWRPSLDRINNSKGYTRKNIRLVAWIVNHCRGELDDETFIYMCRKVAEYE